MDFLELNDDYFDSALTTQRTNFSRSQRIPQNFGIDADEKITPWSPCQQILGFPQQTNHNELSKDQKPKEKPKPFSKTFINVRKFKGRSISNEKFVPNPKKIEIIQIKENDHKEEVIEVTPYNNQNSKARFLAAYAGPKTNNLVEPVKREETKEEKYEENSIELNNSITSEKASFEQAMDSYLAIPDLNYHMRLNIDKNRSFNMSRQRHRLNKSRDSTFNKNFFSQQNRMAHVESERDLSKLTDTFMVVKSINDRLPRLRMTNNSISRTKKMSIEIKTEPDEQRVDRFSLKKKSLDISTVSGMKTELNNFQKKLSIVGRINLEKRSKTPEKGPRKIRYESESVDEGKTSLKLKLNILRKINKTENNNSVSVLPKTNETNRLKEKTLSLGYIIKQNQLKTKEDFAEKSSDPYQIKEPPKETGSVMRLRPVVKKRNEPKKILIIDRFE